MRRLLRLYPRGWRLRYEVEFGALLEQCPITPATLFDTVRGALDAHRHPENWQSEGIVMSDAPRGSVLAVFLSFVFFCFAGVAFQQLVDDSPFVPIMRGGGSLNLAWLAVEAGAVVGALALFAAAAPFLATLLRRPHAQWRRFIMPVAAVAAVGLVEVAWMIGSQLLGLSRQEFLPPFLIILGVFQVTVIAASVALARAVLRGEFSAGLFRFALFPALVTTLAMGLMLASTLLWGVFASVSAPAAFAGNARYFDTDVSYGAVLEVIVVLMALATGAAAVSVARGLRTWAHSR